MNALCSFWVLYSPTLKGRARRSLNKIDAVHGVLWEEEAKCHKHFTKSGSICYGAPKIENLLYTRESGREYTFTCEKKPASRDFISTQSTAQQTIFIV